MYKKSQAVMEFLLTYGWAIVVVVVAVSALAYFGVLSPDLFRFKRCVMDPGLTCRDFDLYDSLGQIKLEIIIKNNRGYSLYNSGFSLGGNYTYSTFSCKDNGGAQVNPGNPVPNGEIFHCTATNVRKGGTKLNLKEKHSISFTLIAHNVETGLDGSYAGTITT